MIKFIALFIIVIGSSVKGHKGNFHELLRTELEDDVLRRSSISDNIKKITLTYKKFTIETGKEYKPHDLTESPTIEFDNLEPESFYTIIMTDPDAPSRNNATFREFQHYLKVNIPGSDITKGTVLAEYIGPQPPKGTGLHRYIFYLFKQPSGEVKFEEEFKPANNFKNRKNFKTKKFMETYHLNDPVGANYYVAQFDTPF